MEKKVFCIVAAVALLFVGCGRDKGKGSEEFAYNEQYSYERMEFYRAEGVTIDDLKRTLPLAQAIYPNFYSLDDFENYVREHLDTFHVDVNTGNGAIMHRYFDNHIEEVTFLENDQIFVIYDGEEATLPIKKEENGFVANDEITFLYENGYVYYTLQIVEGYGVKHIFDNE